MGKRLIIKGADFSANGIGGIFTDITSLFSSWSTGTYSAYNGNTGSSSSVFDKSTKVDISSYAGKNIKFTKISYTTASIDESRYGLAFYDTDNNFISGIPFPKYGNTGSMGITYYSIDSIPANAKYLGVTYFNSTKLTEFEGLPFYIGVAQ